jgi:hypothetical protein
MNNKEVEPKMVNKEKLKNPLFLFNAFVLAAFIVLNFVADGYAESARRFPKFVFGIGMAVILFWMVIYFLFPRAMQFIESQEEAEEGGRGDRRRYYRAWFCIVLPILIGYFFGFIFLVPAAFISYGLILGDRKKLVSLMIIMVITTVVFYLGFDYILNIPLLKGVFVDLG